MGVEYVTWENHINATLTIFIESIITGVFVGMIVGFVIFKKRRKI